MIIILPVGKSVNAELPELIATIQSDTNLALFGKRILGLGDQNNDGFDDFLVSRNGSKSFLYYGGNPIDTLYDIIFDTTNGRSNNIGDINQDGYNDFSIAKKNPAYWKINIFFGGPSIDNIPDIIYGADTLYSFGFTVLCGDINNNGFDEIISRSIEMKSVIIYEVDSQYDSIPDLDLFPANYDHTTGYDAFGEGIISGDFNGDGRDDLAVNLRPREIDSINGQVWLYWGGATFDTIPDMIIPRPGLFKRGYNFFGTLLEYLGDVNADGYDDFLAGSGISFEDTVNYIYFGGPDIDTFPDITLYERVSVARLGGDLNKDSHNDIITSYPLSLSSIGHVNIYYGGKDIDNIPDIIINNSDMPEWQQYFGMDCSGVGDVNGDGIDDFAFSAEESITAYRQGVIYIFSGTDSGTDVEYNYEPTLPNDFKLNHNYPNPFNPTTTISFDIPYKTQINLKIYNILGNEVKTLVSKQLQAGSYNLIWDGTDNGGHHVSSGVYFYYLTSDNVSLSNKMVLLK